MFYKYEQALTVDWKVNLLLTYILCRGAQVTCVTETRKGPRFDNLLQSTVLKMASAKEFVQSPSIEVLETFIKDILMQIAQELQLDVKRSTHKHGLKRHIVEQLKIPLLPKFFYSFYSLYKNFLRHSVEMGEVATISQRLYKLLYKQERKIIIVQHYNN